MQFKFSNHMYIIINYSYVHTNNADVDVLTMYIATCVAILASYYQCSYLIYS